MAEETRDIPIHRKEELTEEEGTREGPYFKPEVDIYETDDALTVKADMPGALSENVDIDLRDNVLTIQAGSKDVDERWNPVHEEFRMGNYTRRFRLGQQIDQSAISANFNNGVLELTLPKAERARPRKIQISTS